MGAIKIINGKLVNEGCIEEKDILILNDRIEKISNSIQTSRNIKVFDSMISHLLKYQWKMSTFQEFHRCSNHCSGPLLG